MVVGKYGIHCQTFEVVTDCCVVALNLLCLIFLSRAHKCTSLIILGFTVWPNILKCQFVILGVNYSICTHVNVKCKACRQQLLFPMSFKILHTALISMLICIQDMWIMIIMQRGPPTAKLTSDAKRHSSLLSSTSLEG